MNRPYRQQDAPIDWQALGQRLMAAASATQEALQPSPERARRILDERASILARPSSDPHLARNTANVVNFSIGGENYCVETRCVREVRPIGDVTPLPGVPDFLIGVTNLRGEILPLIDLRCFLELASKGPAAPSHVIICGETRAEFGIVADAMLDVSMVALDELSPDPNGAGEHSRTYVLGIAGNATVVLNGAALLTDRRLFVEGAGLTHNARGDS